MGLKQSIVVKNQFTVKTGDSGGRRGTTPGRYVTRYMARKRGHRTNSTNTSKSNR